MPRFISKDIEGEGILNGHSKNPIRHNVSERGENLRNPRLEEFNSRLFVYKP